MASTRARQSTKGTKATTAEKPPLPMLPTDGPALISVGEAAKRTGIGRTVLYPYIMDGTLPSVRPGKSERKVLATALPGFIAWLLEQERAALGLAS